MSATAAAPGFEARLLAGLAAARPRILYGLRMMGSVTLAMWIAFWLQLQDASWAPTTAAIVCQPTIGASLRKGQFRVIGTCLGATGIVTMVALLPQSRWGLVGELILWGSAAAFCTTLLRNAAAYAAALGGYTAAIVFGDVVTASTPNDAFMLAVDRATEISIGVLSAGLVLSATDIGDGRKRLARQFAKLVGGIGAGIATTLREQGRDGVEYRREMIEQLVAIDPVIDEVQGESAELRWRSATLTGGVEGVLRALSAWRGIMTHLVAILDHPSVPFSGVDRDTVEGLARLDWLGDPAGARAFCLARSRTLLATQASSVSDRLIRDRLAEALLALGRAANAIALLATPKLAVPDHSRVHLHVPDLMTPVVNALRTALTMGMGAVIWIEPPWPDGQGAIEFAAVITILFAPQADRAAAIVVQFGVGVIAAATLAAIVEFGVLQQVQSFVALNLAIAAVLVPAAAMAAGTWKKFFFVAICFIFFALLAPANEQSYNFQSFLNGAIGIVIGVLMGLLGFRLVPPVPTRWRTRRLLSLSLRDVRRFAAGRKRPSQGVWLGRATARVTALPPDAQPGDRARLVSAYSAGEQVLRLRRLSERLRAPWLLEAGLSALARGAPEAAIAELDRLVEAQGRDDPGLRMRSEVVLLIDVLARNQSFFADRPAAPGF